MQYDELLDYLQNLTQQKITQQEIGDALNISKQAVGKKKTSGYDFLNLASKFSSSVTRNIPELSQAPISKTASGC